MNMLKPAERNHYERMLQQHTKLRDQHQQSIDRYKKLLNK